MSRSSAAFSAVCKRRRPENASLQPLELEQRVLMGERRAVEDEVATLVHPLVEPVIANRVAAAFVSPARESSDLRLGLRHARRREHRSGESRRDRVRLRVPRRNALQDVDC